MKTIKAYLTHCLKNLSEIKCCSGWAYLGNKLNFHLNNKMVLKSQIMFCSLQLRNTPQWECLTSFAELASYSIIHVVKCLVLVLYVFLCWKVFVFTETTPISTLSCRLFLFYLTCAYYIWKWNLSAVWVTPHRVVWFTRPCFVYGGVSLTAAIDGHVMTGSNRLLIGGWDTQHWLNKENYTRRFPAKCRVPFWRGKG